MMKGRLEDFEGLEEPVHGDVVEAHADNPARFRRGTRNDG